MYSTQIVLWDTRCDTELWIKVLLLPVRQTVWFPLIGEPPSVMFSLFLGHPLSSVIRTMPGSRLDPHLLMSFLLLLFSFSYFQSPSHKNTQLILVSIKTNMNTKTPMHFTPQSKRYFRLMLTYCCVFSQITSCKITYLFFG